MNQKLTIKRIHQDYVPHYDRWHGRLKPRIISWFSHILEIISLWVKGNKPYWKHGRTLGTCRQHSQTEFGDFLWLTAEMIFMLTKVELPIVSQYTMKRVRDKMEEKKDE